MDRWSTTQQHEQSNGRGTTFFHGSVLCDRLSLLVYSIQDERIEKARGVARENFFEFVFELLM